MLYECGFVQLRRMNDKKQTDNLVKAFEMWFWRRLKKILEPNRVNNYDILKSDETRKFMTVITKIKRS